MSSCLFKQVEFVQNNLYVKFDLDSKDSNVHAFSFSLQNLTHTVLHVTPMLSWPWKMMGKVSHGEHARFCNPGTQSCAAKQHITQSTQSGYVWGI